MILFLSDGRLGNQLFQYAFLNTIAKENEIIFAINMQDFVEKFDIKNQNFKHLELGKYSLFFARKLLKPFFFEVLVRLRAIGYIWQDCKEASALSSYHKKKGIFPIWLVETNFFQSELFFENSKINFKIKNLYIKKAQKFLNKIPLGYSKIFVHVRRGDYKSESYLGMVGIELPTNYFYSAINQMCQIVEKPFFIFLTDDSIFVESCFSNIKNMIVSKNNKAIDFAIMTLCEYGVVSNSSFSWWGAYFMKNRKKVIFPKYWYGWKHKTESHIDIQPKWADVIEVENDMP